MKNWYIIKEREGGKQKDSRNGSEIKKTDARKKGEEICPGSGGKNIHHGTTVEQKWGIGTTVSA
jgi:hypothetical protein